MQNRPLPFPGDFQLAPKPDFFYFQLVEHSDYIDIEIINLKEYTWIHF
jgi:hypothetical protein